MAMVTIDIPNKSHFKLNEVCGLTGIKPYVLRFWESEFEEIAPILSSSGQKLYEHKDIEILAIIKKLLFDDKLSIEQAKLELRTYLAQHNPERQFEDDTCNTVETHNDSEGESELATGGLNSHLQMFRRNLSDKDIEKLSMAKERLNSLMEMTQTLQERNHWS